MAKLLYIIANPNAQEYSYSKQVGAAFLEAYRAAHPSDEIIEFDVYNTNLPLIDADVFGGWGKLRQGAAFDTLTDAEQAKVGRLNEIVDQFIDADKYVFVTPLWNFGVPPMMKAYIDSISIAGKTFKYTEQGPIGLLKGQNKKLLHIQASGSVFSTGPIVHMEHGTRYVKDVLNFLGVEDTQAIYVEGMGMMPTEAETIKANAIERAKEAAASF